MVGVVWVCVSVVWFFMGVDDCVVWFHFLSLCVKASAHLGVKCVFMHRDLMCSSGFICSCVCACVTVRSDLCVCVVFCRDMWNEEAGFAFAHVWTPTHPLCLWALLAQACLSIFVTGLKFDVSYFQLTASEPCMNELVIYTKCLIKSAPAPGINIVERLGIFTASGWGFAQRCICGYHIIPGCHLDCSVALCDSGLNLAQPARLNIRCISPNVYI